MANVKLRLTATYYRLPVEGAGGKLLRQGDEFETDEANAERLVNAGAAEPVRAARKTATPKSGDGEGDDAKTGESAAK